MFHVQKFVICATSFWFFVVLLVVFLVLLFICREVNFQYILLSLSSEIALVSLPDIS